MNLEPERIAELVALAVGSGVSGAVAQTRFIRRRLAKLERTVKALRAELVDARSTLSARITLLEGALLRRAPRPASPKS